MNLERSELNNLCDFMYKEEILDHYKRPRNEGRLETEYEAEGENTSCGDDTHIYLETEDDKISDLKHETDACAICTSAISIISEELKGEKVDEVKELDDEWVLDNLGIDVSPMRMKCVKLGLETTKKALQKQ